MTWYYSKYTTNIVLLGPGITHHWHTFNVVNLDLVSLLIQFRFCNTVFQHCSSFYFHFLFSDWLITNRSVWIDVTPNKITPLLNCLKIRSNGKGFFIPLFNYDIFPTCIRERYRTAKCFFNYENIPITLIIMPHCILIDWVEFYRWTLHSLISIAVKIFLFSCS